MNNLEILKIDKTDIITILTLYTIQSAQIKINKSCIVTILEINKKITLTKPLFMVQYNYVDY